MERRGRWEHPAFREVYGAYNSLINKKMCIYMVKKLFGYLVIFHFLDWGMFGGSGLLDYIYYINIIYII